MGFHTNTKKEVPKTTVVIQLPSSKIDQVKTLISAYAVPGQLPDDVADLLWQVHRGLKNKKSP